MAEQNWKLAIEYRDRFATWHVKPFLPDNEVLSQPTKNCFIVIETWRAQVLACHRDSDDGENQPDRHGYEQSVTS